MTTVKLLVGGPQKIWMEITALIVLEAFLVPN